MKLPVAGALVVALGLLTAGCSSGSPTKAAASSAAPVPSATGTAAPSPSAVATPPAAGSSGVTSSAAPAGSPTTAPATAAGGSTAATTTSASQGSASPTASAVAGGTAAAIAVCTTLPTAQVASISGKALTHSREQDSAALNAYECSYYTASGFGGMSITVQAVQGAIAYANILSNDKIEGSAENVTPRNDIGDKAFSATDGIHVLFGDRLISVAGVTAVPVAETVVKALEAKLT